jgi:quinol monooxygenase YgiN
MKMRAVALSVTLKAKPGKEQELGAFLASAQSLVAQENETITWFAYRIDAQTFGIFDSFNDEAGRQAHLNGSVAAALLGRAEELLVEQPEIWPVDILAEKLPG